MLQYWHVRKTAAEALVRIGNAAVKPLLATLNDENWHVRNTAAWALGYSGDPGVVKSLIKLAINDTASAYTAIKALTRVIECAAAITPAGELRLIATLPRLYVPSYTDDPDGEIDCSHVKKRARQELKRRGLKV